MSDTDTTTLTAATDTTTTTDTTTVDTTTVDDTTTDVAAVDTTATTDDDTPALKAPETYEDFNLPEGVELNEGLLEKAGPMFKDLDLTQEQAQKLVDFQAELSEQNEQGIVEAFNKQVETWQTESKNDKEFGGEKFDENLATAKLTMEKFGTPEFSKLMDDHAVSNHPEMIRFMWNIGKLLKEDVPGGLGGALSMKKDRAEVLYGTK